jgi:hypothetical protein
MCGRLGSSLNVHTCIRDHPDEAEFQLKDLETEKRFHFRLEDVLQRTQGTTATSPDREVSLSAHGKLLYTGMEFYLDPAVKPSPDILKRLVLACGGQVVSQLTPAFFTAPGQLKAAASDGLTRLVITCNDSALTREAAALRMGQLTARRYLPEFILTGVLVQELCFGKEFEVS